MEKKLLPTVALHVKKETNGLILPWASCVHFSLLDKQRYLLAACMSQRYLSEFRVQTLRFENHDLFRVLHYLLYDYGRRTDCHVTNPLSKNAKILNIEGIAIS